MFFYLFKPLQRFLTDCRWYFLQKECIFQTGTLYLIPACCTVFVVNIVARLKFGISHIPEMGIMVVSWSIATACLILGGKFAHSSMIGRRATCATIRIQSQILIKSWFTKIPIQMFLGGLIPFIFIFPEMDNIYASLWNLKICGAFQTMLISFTLIIAYTVIVAIGFTSYELFMEKDYQLFWRYIYTHTHTHTYIYIYVCPFLLHHASSNLEILHH